MDKTEKTSEKQIVVKRCAAWSRSTSRKMKTIGKAASSAALQQAKATGVAVSYLKDGVIVKSEA